MRERERRETEAETETEIETQGEKERERDPMIKFLLIDFLLHSRLLMIKIAS